MNHLPLLQTRHARPIWLLIAILLAITLFMMTVTAAAQPAVQESLTAGQRIAGPQFAGEADARPVQPSLAAQMTLLKAFKTDTVTPGQTSSLTIQVDNTQGSALTSVRITDTVDSRLEVTTVQGSIGALADSDGNVQTVQWLIGSLSGQDTAYITVTFSVKLSAAAGTVNNTANAKAGMELADDDDNVEILPVANLSLTKAFVASPVAAGQSSKFTIKVGNDGPSVASNLKITDTVDARLVVTGVIGDLGMTNENDGNAQTVQWKITTLAVNQTATITVSYAITPGVLPVSIENEAQAADNDGNEAQGAASVQIQRVVSLNLDKAFSTKPISAGDSSSFTIQVANGGPSNASSVRITDTVDARLQVTGVSGTDGAEADSDGQVQTVQWLINPLTAGDVATITVDFDVVATTSATINNSAIAADSDNNNSEDSDSVLVKAPIFEIKKKYQSSRIAGLPVTYTLTYSNTGDGVGNGLVITDRLPSNVTYLSGGDAFASGIISWDRSANLSPGNQASVSFSARLGCSGSVNNNSYRVAESNQGVTSPLGPAVQFNILPATMTAGFNQSDTEIDPGQTVYFTSTSTTNGLPLIYEWDFGDGTTGSGKMVSHTYNKAGILNVKLTVKDQSNCQSKQAQHTLTVRTYVYLPLVMKPDVWKEIGPASWPTNESARSVAVCSTNNTIIFAGSRNQQDPLAGKLLQWSGSAWQTVGGNFPSGKAVVSLVMTSNCNTLYAAVSKDGVWRGDKGAGSTWSWTKLTGGTDVSEIRDIALSGTRLFAAGQFSLAYWNGSQWQTASLPGGSSKLMMDLAVADPSNNSGPVYAVQWVADYVWRNSDPVGNPGQWSQLTSLAMLPDNRSLVLSANSTNVQYVGTQGGSYRLVGSGWQPVKSTITWSLVSFSNFVYAGYGSNAGVYYSFNSGANFLPLNQGFSPVPADILSLEWQQGKLYAGTTDGVWVIKQ